MAEGQVLFSLDRKGFKFGTIRWFNLQHEFNTKGVTLSQSLLVWRRIGKNVVAHRL